MDNIYKNIKIYKLFIRGRKLNIFLAFITQSYFALPKYITLNSTHYFIMKTPNKRGLEQITFNHSSDINFQDVMNFYKICTAKPYSSLVIDNSCIRQSFTFQKEPFKKKKLIMTIGHKITDEKQQYNKNQ